MNLGNHHLKIVGRLSTVNTSPTVFVTYESLLDTFLFPGRNSVTPEVASIQAHLHDDLDL